MSWPSPSPSSLSLTLSQREQLSFHSAQPRGNNSNCLYITFGPLLPNPTHTHPRRQEGGSVSSTHWRSRIPRQVYQAEQFPSRSAPVMGEPLAPTRRGESGKAGDQEDSEHHPTRLRPQARKLSTTEPRPAPRVEAAGFCTHASCLKVGYSQLLVV